MNHTEIAQGIIETLRHIRQRPTLWVIDLSNARGFLFGINKLCELMNMHSGYDSVYIEVAKKRGWEWSPVAAIFPSMKERGLDEMAMILELIDIEIEVWELRYNLGETHILQGQSTLRR